MGIYLNPGIRGFKEIKTDDYIDKSGLLAVINKTINGQRRLSCVSRPRRFGKSYAAQMIASYYSAGCDSSVLFDDLEIARDPAYHTFMNQYHVIYLDIAKFIPMTELKNLPEFISKTLREEIAEDFPQMHLRQNLDDCLLTLVEQTGKKFIAVIDEWDAPIRMENAAKEEQKRYLEFLRMLFKSQLTNSIFAAAYMTGILPIKKDGSQSAISEFREYTMIDPGEFAPFIGFTEEEVRKLCADKDVSYEKMKIWYDGYQLEYQDGYVDAYNAHSVMEAVYTKKYKSYWRQTSAANGLRDYINMDFDGLGTAAEKLLAGLELPVRVTSFKNDLQSFESADDVLTLLIHFGYLSYDSEKESVRVPNHEIALEFADMIHTVTHKETILRVKESEKLLSDVVSQNADAVAAAIQKIHMEESSMKYYNNEQALRSVIKLAFFTYRDHYIKLEELDSGTGYADIVFLPKKYDDHPALVVELKYEETAKGAIAQIKSRNYPEVLKDYGAEILLVGISYDRADVTKQHHCMIEKESGRKAESSF